MALQHLRSSTASKRPTPSGMSDGQIAVNTNDSSPGLFFKDSNNNLVKVGPVHIGATAPNISPASGGTAGNSKGESWLDTTNANPLLKVWDGTAWQIVQPVASGTVISTTSSGAVTSAMIADGTILNVDINNAAAIAYSKLALSSGIVNTDISATAEIAVSKLADGSARQLLQTDATGSGVEWTSNVDVPGTLDVTGATTFDSTVVVNTTGSLTLPDGTTAQRPVTPATGDVRFNTSLIQFEGYNGTAWGTIGGGAKGGGSDQVFFENDQNVTTNYTLTSGKNAVSAGPITIASGVTVTVPSGVAWVIV